MANHPISKNERGKKRPIQQNPSAAEPTCVNDNDLQRNLNLKSKQLQIENVRRREDRAEGEKIALPIGSVEQIFAKLQLKTPNEDMNQSKRKEHASEQKPYEEWFQNPVSLNEFLYDKRRKLLFVVGNTSQYLYEMAPLQNHFINSITDSTTNTLKSMYQWLVYIDLKDESRESELKHYVEKVRFYLHESYAPIDAVDVNKPPFQITRNGCIEFPIRVKLFFHNGFNQKPIELLHNIVLKRTSSVGTISGAETSVEVWLKDPRFSTHVKPSLTPLSNTVEEVRLNSIQKSVFNLDTLLGESDNLMDESLMDFLDKIDTIDVPNIEEIQPSIIVTESDEQSTSLPRTFNTRIGNVRKCSTMPFANVLPFVPLETSEGPKTDNENVCNQNLLEDFGNANKIMQSCKISVSNSNELKVMNDEPLVPKVESGLPIHFKGNRIKKPKLDAIEEHLTSKITKTRPVYNNQLYSSNDLLDAEFSNEEIMVIRPQFEENFLKLNFKGGVRQAVEFLLRRAKLIENEKPSFNNDLYHFSSYTLDQFQSMSVIEQKCTEWLRAKYISDLISKHGTLCSGDEGIWTTGEIVEFARQFAYTPPIKSVWRKTNAMTAVEKENLPPLSVETVPQKLTDGISDQSKVIQWLTFANGVGKKKVKDFVTCQQSPSKMPKIYRPMIYMGIPWRYKHAYRLLSCLCDDIGLRLEPEELLPNVTHRTVPILLSHCLLIFLEKLLRQTIAYITRSEDPSRRSGHGLQWREEREIRVQDIIQTIVTCQKEFDYLSNSHCGTNSSHTPRITRHTSMLNLRDCFENRATLTEL